MLTNSSDELEGTRWTSEKLRHSRTIDVSSK